MSLIGYALRMAKKYYKPETYNHALRVAQYVAENPMIPAFFNPLFLVKDFNSNGEIKTDTTFMTNADTLYIAKEGIQNISDKNPFTGKTLIPDSKEKVHIWSIQNSEWNSDNVLLNKKFTLKPEESWIVKENLFDKNNWMQGKPKKRILKKNSVF